MLISFSVANFCSFNGEQTFSMVAGEHLLDHPDHPIALPGNEQRLLPVAAIHGANGGGKSNLFKALGFLAELAAAGREWGSIIGRMPFVLDGVSARKPTQFRIQFAQGGGIYAFGCEVGETQVEREWLSVIEKGKEVAVYQRTTSAKGTIAIEPGPALDETPAAVMAKLLRLAQKKGRPNELFLTTAATGLRAKELPEAIAGPWRWFCGQIEVVTHKANIIGLAELVRDKPDFVEIASQFLKRANTGVERLRLIQAGKAETQQWLAVPGIMQTLLEGEAESPMEAATTNFHMPNGWELLVETEPGREPVVKSLFADHLTADGKTVPFPFSEESEGTRRLTQLLVTLWNVCSRPKLVAIDDIDQHLHPLLLKAFIRHFLENRKETGGQLIFTSHRTEALDLDLLRRDEIWFANKPLPPGATELYSLADYKTHTDPQVGAAYLQGAFRAVPPTMT